MLKKSRPEAEFGTRVIEVLRIQVSVSEVKTGSDAKQQFDVSCRKGSPRTSWRSCNKGECRRS